MKYIKCFYDNKIKYFIENKLTYTCFGLVFIIALLFKDYFSILTISLCIIIIYYNFKKNVQFNASFQQLFDENSKQKLELLKSAAELDTFFEITPMILAIASLGEYKRVSDNFLQTLGYTKEEVINHSFFAFIHPDDHQKTIDMVSEIQGDTSTILNFTNRVRAKDGHYITIKWQTVLQNNTFYASGTDVTNEIAFKLLFEQIATPLCIFDKELFLFSSVNKAFSSKLGYDESEMMGRNLSDFIYEEDLNGSIKASKLKKRALGYQNRYVCKNGEIKTLKWTTLGNDDRFSYCAPEFLN